MNIFTLIIIAVGLSMDAFAVSVTNGLCYSGLQKKQAFYIAATFGFFQGAMTLLGYFLGYTVSSYVSEIDHWIAFVILGAIGSKMIIESVTEKKESDNDNIVIKVFNVKELMVQGVATSIDALAAALTFAALDTGIWVSSLFIGSVTFIICLLGVFIGKESGAFLKQKAVITGGIILILIGLKILFEHLFF